MRGTLRATILKTKDFRILLVFDLIVLYVVCTNTMSENDIYRFAVVVLAINLILWFLVGYYVSYLEFSDSELLISNDVWFWKEKRYTLKDVRTVSLCKVSNGRGSKSIMLEVTTSDGVDKHCVNMIDLDPAAIARFIDILNKKGIVAKAELDT